MVYAPQTQSGSFFNDQEREVASHQWVEALSVSRQWHGQHVFKVGTDLQRSQFTGTSASRPLEIRRLDGSLAELTVFGNRTEQDVSGFEFGTFAQDRWRVGSRMTLELGLRLDRDAVVERVNWSPRAGVAISVAPDGRAILRGGYGKFVQRTPLNIDAFSSFEPRTVTRFAQSGALLGLPRLRPRARHRSAAPKRVSATGVEPALRPASALQDGVHETRGLARVHRHAGSGGA
jgi:hypothetical protein